jgi:hypothetical protein
MENIEILTSSGGEKISYFVQKLLLSGQLYGKKGSHFSDRQSAVKEKQCNVLRKLGLLPPYRETKI